MESHDTTKGVGMKVLIAVAVWIAVGLLGANLWVSYQMLEQLNSEDTGPIAVSVDWENQKVVAVDIAEVSHGKDDGWENGVLPVWNPWYTDDNGDLDWVEFRTRVENTVDVDVVNRVRLSEPVGVDVWNWP